ncbi:MAG: excisionase family DNA-binding protein [Chloroflexi bacterium]|nr:excisionase family DNA-binding protein [Chloroflexota bacterium]
MTDFRYLPSTKVAEMQLYSVVPVLQRLVENHTERDGLIQLVDKKSEETLEIALATLTLVKDILDRLSTGDPITLIPGDAELTDLEAADVLNVSRSFLIKLLENDEISHSRIRSLYRVRMDDLMAYKVERDKRADEALDEMVRISEELGLYDL